MRPLFVPFFIPHLGCPHRCVFCDQEKVAGARGVLPSAEELVARIEAYRAGAPGRSLEAAFYGGTFTALPLADQEALLAPLQPLLERGSLASIRLSTRPDAVDGTTAVYLKERGVATVELGVQSLDPEVLTLSGRGHGVAEVGLAVAALKGAGIAVGIQLMPGLPGDTKERSLSTLRAALALSPSFLRIYPTLVIEGTELAERYRCGAYTPLALPDAVSLCKEMLVAAAHAGIPVIRVGLQPTAELERPGTLIAGPYHPAFGQLVASGICFDVMCTLLDGVPAGSRVSFGAPRGRVSDLVGQKRGNLVRLAERHGINAEVHEDPALTPELISLEWEGGVRYTRRPDLHPQY